METPNEEQIEHPVDKAARLLEGRSGLAARLGVTVSALGNWKVRGVPIEMAVPIERATSGEVTRRDLRPDDWAAIWPELAANTPPNLPPAHAGIAQAAIETVAEGGAHVIA